MCAMQWECRLKLRLSRRVVCNYLIECSLHKLKDKLGSHFRVVLSGTIRIFNSLKRHPVCCKEGQND